VPTSVATESEKSEVNGVKPSPELTSPAKFSTNDKSLNSKLPDVRAPSTDFARRSIGANTTEEEKKLFAVKTNLIKSWAPEYMPEDVRPLFFSPDVQSERATNVTLDQILQKQEHMSRKTKIVCTAGPGCWSAETLSKLLDAGLNVLRFNFSHGDHQGHYEVLERYKQVCLDKGSRAATLLDTKGPEIRTAMLRDHKPISLEAGQSIIVEAVGAKYMEFEGYKEEGGETRIGLSYEKLCQSVKSGNLILLADGSISIRVDEIVSDRELRGTVLNSKSLGERKNCNLPGVKVEIPVLTEKDINDLQNFAAKHEMDFVAASFVQSKADVEFIRRVLDEAGGHKTKIISKIENLAGVHNFDEILQVTDGVMVARGDLGMEIPSEKVPVAQKLMITKCNCAGKFVICATQMLESMISNPRPTRAEMTDVANAVYDGVDCVMLSGETANGEFADTAVATMAAIVATAEIGVDYYSQLSFIRYWATKYCSSAMSSSECILSSTASMAVGFHEDDTPELLRLKRAKQNRSLLIVCLTNTGEAAAKISKYRPPCPVVVVSTEEFVLRRCSVSFGLIPLKVDTLDMAALDIAHLASEEVARVCGFSEVVGTKVILAMGRHGGCADAEPVVTAIKLGSGMRKDKGWSTANMLTIPTVTPTQRPGVRSMRSTLTSLPLIVAPAEGLRRTKIICTMGPACWNEEKLGLLLDAGMDIARFNFSHGDHAGQLEVLERLRKVWGQKEAAAKSTKDIDGPRWACLLDTKGPEIRTAMLRGHQPISLEAGQSIIVEAVGATYMEFEGYKEEGGETRIGLSYDKLCQSVKPGNLILLSDGSISVRVDEITSDRELRGTVLNSKVLGERKNCNLPGVKVEIPVLTEKDIDDLQNFAAKHRMDFVAASFVQSAADVQFIRSVLNGAKGGESVKIISKIENAEGLRRYDEILEASDGIMVARGDMGMEIPPEKVPLAQKMLITKANIAGKFIITATQMLESMINSPRPTRAEMTDVANAVLDGTDAVMLSGETANGQFPELVVSTMAALCQNAEEMVDADKLYNFLRNHTPKPMMGVEAICSGAVQTAMDSKAKAILCITTSGRAPALVSKFRPPMPVLVVTTEPQLVKQCRSMFGQVGILLKPSTSTSSEDDVHNLIEEVRAYCKAMDIVDLRDGDSMVVLNRRSVARDQALPYDDQRLVMKALVLGESGNPEIISTPRQMLSEGAQRTIIYHRSTKLSMDTIIDDNKYKYFTRKTKIVCTAGPACWDEANLGNLLDAGMSVLRFNFSHGDHAGHLQVLERFRKVCAAKGSTAATLLDTKGPEIRTAMLRDHKPISLEAGQSIIVEAVGAKYMEFEGYKEEGGETRIGLSYDKLCQSVKPGNLILLADGSISIRVDEIVSDRELRGTVLNSKSLGERKNCNLPGVKVEIPVLTEKDVNDLQNFAAKHKMDFVAASFVQTKEDVLFIRSVLDKAGGHSIKIISKIENCEGVENFDDILEYSDGIMVARGDLGMEISVEKVPLAQKVMITKANLAGKFAITATQMLESMITSPIPTRAEMTDVANAVVDGTDAVMLSGESANGKYPDLAVATMARICRSAEIGVNVYQTFDFIRTFTPKPVPPVEAVCAALAKNAVDALPGMIIIFSETGKTPRLLAKYRPPAPVLVVTSNEYLARHCSCLYAMHAMMLSEPINSVGDIPGILKKALQYGVEKGLCSAGKEVVVLSSTFVASKAFRESERLLRRELFVTIAPGTLDMEALGSLAPVISAQDPKLIHKTLTMRSTVVSMDMITSDLALPVRKTKIAATIGPASRSPETLHALVAAGMDMARFKFSHATPTTHAETLTNLRQIASEAGRCIATIMDLQGPEVRTSYLVDRANGNARIARIELHAGERVAIYGTDDLTEANFVGYRTDAKDSTEPAAVIKVDLPDLAMCVKKGSIIHLMDGAVTIDVEDINTGRGVVVGLVRNRGALGERKVVHVAGVTVHRAQASMQDMADIQSFAVQHGVDYIAASQVQSATEIEALRNFLDDCGGEHIGIIAKIETLGGLRQFDEILGAADAIMLARGALGLAIPPEKVPLAQAKITTKCKIAGKPLIIARHMLESMTSSPRPTRAEMTDVANAVLDGTDAVMLCSETSSGAFPADALRTMDRICRSAEAATNYGVIHSFIRDFSMKPFNTLEAAAVALAALSTKDNAIALAVVFSDDGQAAGGLYSVNNKARITISSHVPLED